MISILLLASENDKCSAPCYSDNDKCPVPCYIDNNNSVQPRVIKYRMNTFLLWVTISLKAMSKCIN